MGGGAEVLGGEITWQSLYYLCEREMIISLLLGISCPVGPVSGSPAEKGWELVPLS